MSLAYGEQGQYSRAVESPQAQLKPPPQIKVQFVDVTKAAGIVSKGNSAPKDLIGSGACLIDYDGDGHLDILLADGGSEGGLSLFHNAGGGKFEDVTKKAALDPSLHAYGCSAGDYDNDGAVDLVITADQGIRLLHNEKNGTFKDVSQIAGVQPAKLKGHDGLAPIGVTFVDYDHDGDIDLYVTEVAILVMDEPRKPKASPMSPNRVFRNNGNATFTEVTEDLGLTSEADSLSAIGTDYNNDRAVDLVVTRLEGTPKVFENPREGKFVSREPWSQTRPDRTQAVTALDFDHDGWLDFAFTQLEAPALTLWRNNHAKTFDQVKLPETNWKAAYGVAAFDYDNDGWIDLVAVGETKDGKGEVRLFRNLGPDGFKDVTTDVGLDKIQLKEPRAIITGDYDNDGATDLLITQNHGAAVLLRDEGATQNHWLKLSLKGLNDNKSAIGTKVEVFSGGNRQKFEIYGSNGYLGQNSTDILR